jgi:RNAse (barnase) inhibitor barstar
MWIQICKSFWGCIPNAPSLRAGRARLRRKIAKQRRQRLQLYDGPIPQCTQSCFNVHALQRLRVLYVHAAARAVERIVQNAGRLFGSIEMHETQHWSLNLTNLRECFVYRNHVTDLDTLWQVLTIYILYMPMKSCWSKNLQINFCPIQDFLMQHLLLNLADATQNTAVHILFVTWAGSGRVLLCNDPTDINKTSQ